MLVSPLSFGLAVMFPKLSDFRGRDSLLSVLTLIHSRAHTFTPSHLHIHTHNNNMISHYNIGHIRNVT